MSRPVPLAILAPLLAPLLALACSPCAFAEDAHAEDVKLITAPYAKDISLGEYLNAYIEKCAVRLNNGSEYSFKRYAHPVPGKVVAPYSYDGYDCNLRINNIDENDGGYWTVFVYKKGEEKPVVFKYRIDVIKVIGGQWAITVYNNHYVYMSVDRVETQFEDLVGCKAVGPHGDTYDVQALEDERFTPFGECGVKMLATNESQTGVWSIYAQISEFFAYKTSFEVAVRYYDAERDQEKIFSLKRHERGSVTVGPRKTTYCQIRDPRGVVVTERVAPCQYEIPTVTSLHDGVWTALYGLYGKMDLVQINFNVTTYEEKPLNTTVETGPEGEISLGCHFRVESFSSCQFVRPDGEVIYYIPKVANGGYSSYGNTSFATYDPQQQFCGLKIWQPRAWDYGAWRCKISTSDRTFGTIFHVRDSAKYSQYSSLIKTRAKDVIVRRGDRLQIGCSADEVLSYCWLRSPNGTAYSIAESSTSPNVLRYEGSGLAFGDCRATLPAADDTHRGEWKCFMGIVNGTELEERLNVAVTDSYLMADRETITVRSNRPGWLSMSCRLHPEIADKTIDYCRWVRPDGYGINYVNDGVYVTSRNDSACSIFLFQSEKEANIGKWRCVAGLRIGSKVVEASANIELQRNREQMSMTYMVLTCVVIFAVLSTIAVLVVVRLRRRALSALSAHAPSHGSPPAYPVGESYLPPKYP